ncbi:hypothetical protein [Acinetobacter baumannii]|uniref:hypothetical protein n=1 Tax=Acinetobacter baumannii TaxID=470 RepID=UPI001020B83C|nr:hypothetical protein EWO92_19275 [Acinetobacter baumannii]RYL26030.1 hypothetical protein EWO96_19305 [Acinetobacter baumannii]RYL41662.1 hypothetical protein EWP49_19410 [Acinetobacter baumannii]CAA0290268.1 hypothetical protein AB945B12_03978 [Acinetobacter baumannii]
MKLTDFQKKLVWGVGILLIVFLWIVFPFIFKLLIEAYKFPNDFKDFGPFGDIYGSLNTLISSIALCAVAYSTYMQTKGLEETRKANKQQLSISEYAIFSSQLYDLLNFKSERVKALVINRKLNKTEDNDNKQTNKSENIDNKNQTNKNEVEAGNKEIQSNVIRIEGFEVFRVYHSEFLKLLDTDWKGKCDSLDRTQVKSMFHKLSKRINNDQHFYELGNYFNLYTQIFSLIDNNGLSKEQKEAAISLVRATMTLSEQVTMFFVGGYKDDLNDIIEGKEIFNTFYSRVYVPFARQFYDETYFKSERWKKKFNRNI